MIFNSIQVFTGTFNDTTDKFDVVEQPIGSGQVYIRAISPNDLIDGEYIVFNVSIS